MKSTRNVWIKPLLTESRHPMRLSTSGSRALNRVKRPHLARVGTRALPDLKSPARVLHRTNRAFVLMRRQVRDPDLLTRRNMT